MSAQADTTPTSAALEAWIGLLRAHAATTRALSAELLRDHGLTINDYEALLHLARAEECSMRRVDLAERLLLTAAGSTRLLDGLEDAGLVAKRACSSDRRVTYAVLTEAGRERLADASGSHLAAVRALFEERFGDDELTELAQLLGRLARGAAADGADCSVPRVG